MFVSSIMTAGSSATDPDVLRTALADHANGLVRVGVEASSIGVWLHRELQVRGLPMITVKARHMRQSLSAMRNKTDRNDARWIAQMIRLGWFRAVHVKCVENQKMKTLLANRRLLKRKLIDLENHIRGALRTCGLRVGQVSRNRFEGRVRELLGDADFILETMIGTMLEARRATMESSQSCTGSRCRSSSTIPCAGASWRPWRRSDRRADVQGGGRRSAPIHAFAHGRRALWTDAAPLPVRHLDRLCGTHQQTGGRQCQGRVVRGGRGLLMRSRRWSALKAWGMRIVKRTSMMCAIVAVARKLATILHRMWIDGSEFQWTAARRSRRRSD